MKNTPVFRIVVTDGRSPRDGRFIEEIGTYWPLKEGADNFTINLDRTKYWRGVGAQPSETVASIIKRALRAEKGLDPKVKNCLLYTSPSPRDATLSRMPSSA